jgi:hypothetical protein
MCQHVIEVGDNRDAVDMGDNIVSKMLGIELIKLSFNLLPDSDGV